MYDEEKVDEVVLALSHLNAFQDRGVIRAWKSLDWDALDRLHERGLISDPKSRARSVVLTEEGRAGDSDVRRAASERRAAHSTVRDDPLRSTARCRRLVSSRLPYPLEPPPRLRLRPAQAGTGCETTEETAGRRVGKAQVRSGSRATLRSDERRLAGLSSRQRGFESRREYQQKRRSAAHGLQLIGGMSDSQSLLVQRRSITSASGGRAAAAINASSAVVTWSSSSSYRWP